MWLVEKDPYGKQFRPININGLIYIYIGKDPDNYNSKFYYIEFGSVNSKVHWLKWWFTNETDRDEYYKRILEKLPQLDLGLNSISL